MAPKPKAKAIWPMGPLLLVLVIVGYALGVMTGWATSWPSRETIIERTVTHTVPQDCPLTEKQAREVLGLEGK